MYKIPPGGGGEGGLKPAQGLQLDLSSMIKHELLSIVQNCCMQIQPTREGLCWQSYNNKQLMYSSEFNQTAKFIQHDQA